MRNKAVVHHLDVLTWYLHVARGAGKPRAPLSGYSVNTHVPNPILWRYRLSQLSGHICDNAIVSFWVTDGYLNYKFWRFKITGHSSTQCKYAEQFMRESGRWLVHWQIHCFVTAGVGALTEPLLRNYRGWCTDRTTAS